MTRTLTPDEAATLGRRGAKARRSARMLREVEHWTLAEAPYIHELPALQRRIIDALLRAADAAQGGTQ